MSQEKTSINRTGMMFYDKLQNSSAYRVRFKSFNLAVYDNEQRVNQVNQLYKNYILFKQGKCVTRPLTNGQMNARNKLNEEKKYKTNKQRVRENESLRNRLKSMKQDRRQLFERIKSTSNYNSGTLNLMSSLNSNNNKDFMLTGIGKNN